MRLKALLLVVVTLLALLTSLGTVSCGSDPGSTETQIGLNNTTATLDEIPPSDEEVAYLSETAAITAELNTVFFELDVMLINPEPESDDWIVDVMLALEDMMALSEEASQIVPPDSLADVHTTFMEAMLTLDDAFDILVTAIDEADTGLMNQVSGEMWLAIGILGQLSKPAE